MQWITPIFCVLLVAFVALLFFRIQHLDRWRKEREADIVALQRDIAALCAGAVAVDEHLVQVERQLRRVGERQNQLDMRDPLVRTYGHAIKLAQRGADASELIASCGLAQGEAELILRLHHTSSGLNNKGLHA